MTPPAPSNFWHWENKVYVIVSIFAWPREDSGFLPKILSFTISPTLVPRHPRPSGAFGPGTKHKKSILNLCVILTESDENAVPVRTTHTCLLSFYLEVPNGVEANWVWHELLRLIGVTDRGYAFFSSTTKWGRQSLCYLDSNARVLRGLFPFVPMGKVPFVL